MVDAPPATTDGPVLDLIPQPCAPVMTNSLGRAVQHQPDTDNVQHWWFDEPVWRWCPIGRWPLGDGHSYVDPCGRPAAHPVHGGYCIDGNHNTVCPGTGAAQ